MKLVRAVLVAAVALASAPTMAQPFAMALGHALPAKDTPPDTVVVRVIAGGIGKQVSGADVTLVVNGTPRIARTDSAGRATFAGLPAGAQVQVKIQNEDKAEVASDEFQLGGSTGFRLLMSTRPMGAPGGMTGADGGGGGGGEGDGQPQMMVEPRQASGQPRLERTYKSGSISALVVYDDVKDPQANVPVSLVGYGADDSITLTVAPTNAEGRAEFLNLPPDRRTTYFLLSQLPRGGGALDRLYGRPLELDTKGGVHVILSGAKRASAEPPVDDLTAVQHQDIATDAGKVRVVIQGPVQGAPTINVYDAATKQIVASGKVTRLAPDTKVIQFQGQFGARKDIDPGVLGVIFHGGAAGTKDARLADAHVHLIETTAQPAAAPDPALAEITTNGDGEAVFHLSPTEPTRKYKAEVHFNGGTFTSDEFAMEPGAGAVLEVVAQWDGKGRAEAMIDVPHIAGRVLYAEAVDKPFRFRSVPFQTIPTAGTQVQLYFYPRTLMTFRLGGTVDDTALGVQGTFKITNYSWAPFEGTPDGTIVPLPKGFRGVVVSEGDQDTVATDPGEGFRIVHPIPPGGVEFHGGFSLPLDAGTVDWNMDLPYGAIESSFKVLKTEHMRIDAPLKVEDSVAEGFGPIYSLEHIQIMPQQSMQMKLLDLPHAPAWRLWVPRYLGLAVIFMIITGVAFALYRRPAPEKPVADDRARREARREALLELLVDLEREAHETGKLDDKQRRRRETMITELEALWGDD